MTISDIYSQYATDLNHALESTDISSLEATAAAIAELYHAGGTLFVAGNGGSAATASHMAADLCKTILGKKPTERTKRLRTVALADNMPLITAYGNDVSYESVFGEQLRTLARAGDMLLVITASGNSPNIIYALEAAKSVGVKTVAFVGFGGGKSKEIADITIHIPSNDYGVVEDAHCVLMHVLTAHLKGVIDASHGE